MIACNNNARTIYELLIKKGLIESEDALSSSPRS